MSWGEGDNTSSLELLLDTICNMFGGIILIFILVSILSQFSAQEKITEIIDKEKKQGGVTREVWEQQEQRIAALKRESDEWLAKVGVLTKTGSVEKLPDIGLLYEELQKAESKRKDLAQKLKDVTNKLAEAKTERTGVIAEESDRTPVFCALRFGQFFAIHDVSSPAIPRTHSDRQSDLVTHADGKFEVRLKRDVGQTVADGCEGSGSVRDAMSNIKADREFIHFVVYPDSYPAFEYLLGVLRKKGISHSWLPLPETKDIVISTSALPGKRTIMK